MKRNYYPPECSVLNCDATDVIATSNDTDIIVKVGNDFWGVGTIK